MADAGDLKSSVREDVWVRIPPALLQGNDPVREYTGEVFFSPIVLPPHYSLKQNFLISTVYLYVCQKY